MTGDVERVAQHVGYFGKNVTVTRDQFFAFPDNLLGDEIEIAAPRGDLIAAAAGFERTGAARERIDEADTELVNRLGVGPLACNVDNAAHVVTVIDGETTGQDLCLLDDPGIDDAEGTEDRAHVKWLE